MQAAELLEKMIADLERNGWCQRSSYRTPDGIKTDRSFDAQACLWGAANRLAAHNAYKVTGPFIGRAISDLQPDRPVPVMHRTIAAIWSCIIAFNDNPDTAYEDVILVLKHALELACAEA